MSCKISILWLQMIIMMNLKKKKKSYMMNNYHKNKKNYKDGDHGLEKELNKNKLILRFKMLIFFIIGKKEKRN